MWVKETSLQALMTRRKIFKSFYTSYWAGTEQQKQSGSLVFFFFFKETTPPKKKKNRFVTMETWNVFELAKIIVHFPPTLNLFFLLNRLIYTQEMKRVKISNQHQTCSKQLQTCLRVSTERDRMWTNPGQRKPLLGSASWAAMHWADE